MSVKRFAALAVMLFTLACLFVFPANAETQRVYDRAGLLTAGEIDEINEAAEKYGKNIGFYVITTKTRYWGDDFIRDNNLDEDDDMVFLIITLDRGVYYYDMYYYGKPSERISNSEVDSILDDKAVYDNIKGGRLADGAVAFIGLSAKAAKLPVGKIIFVSVIIGAIVGGIIVGVVVAKYKMKLRTTNYPLDKYARLELREQNDRFIGKHVAVVVTSSGSSGGGGGGGGGGGSSHGGGGGHAGGR